MEIRFVRGSGGMEALFNPLLRVKLIIKGHKNNR